MTASLTPFSFKIEKFTSSQIKEKLTSFGLIDLMSGYGTDEPNDERAAREFLEAAMTHPDPKTIYLALDDNGKAVGSLVTCRWRQNESERGNLFWTALQEADPNFASRALHLSQDAFFIGGIVVDLTQRGKQIAKHLLKEAFENHRYPFVLEGTKTPGQIIAQVRSLYELGYTTFFGRHLITPELEAIPSQAPESLLTAFQKAKKSPLLFTSPSVVSAIPNLTDAPLSFVEAFSDIIALQKKLGSSTAVMKSLISVRNELLS